jgi:predicted nucleotidyltransferase
MATPQQTYNLRADPAKPPGSRARGDATGNSDYDLLVLMDRPVDMTLREGLIECIYPIELDTGAVITLMTYNLNEWESSRYQVMPFHKNVERDGVLL